jgi:kynurenine formamidase
MALLLDELKQRTIYNLEQPRFAGMPVYPNHRPLYDYFIGRGHFEGYFPDTKGPRSTGQGFFIMNDHSGTHMDALCHQALDMTLHGGIKIDNTIETPKGYSKGGAEELPPILARGILLDVAGYKGVSRLPNRYAITAKDLQDTAAFQGTVIQEGDAILVRTGYDTCWNDTKEFLKYAGVSGEASAWIRTLKPVIYGIDQLSWDIPEEEDPLTKSTHWAHIYLLVEDGITMIENMKLDELAKDKVYEFTFLCYPMQFVGATGCPVVPLAIV